MTSGYQRSNAPVQTEALRMTIGYIDDALTALAVWCPHGGDSTRIGDYYTADDARRLLKDAKALLGVANSGV